MQKTSVSGAGDGLNKETVRTVYPVANAQINTSKTIHTQPIDSKTAVYRNSRGVVVWGECK